MTTVRDSYGRTQVMGVEEVAGIIARATGQSRAAVLETLERSR